MEFKKENFDWDGMYLMYYPNGLYMSGAKFVARFKYGSKPWKR